MQLKLLTEEEKKITYRDQILSMMRAADNDFVPPMSARFSPFQTELKGEAEIEGGIVRYYNGMIKESMLCAIEDGKIIGFVTYVENLKNKAFPEGSMPNLYICTLIVRAEARGRGLTYVMYDHLFDTLYPNHSLFTRTWSTNFAHSTILKKYGFSEIHRIANDRGENIDTVYFGKVRNF